MRAFLGRIFRPFVIVFGPVFRVVKKGLVKAFAPVARLVLSIPFVRRRYAKRLLDTIENAPPSTLPPQLRDLKKALQNVPKPRRLAMLEQALANPEQAKAQQEIVASSRQLRRMSQRKGGPPQQFRRPPGRMR